MSDEGHEEHESVKSENITINLTHPETVSETLLGKTVPLHQNQHHTAPKQHLNADHVELCVLLPNKVILILKSQFTA